MPSSYTTSLRLTLPATGELSGQWGNTVNTGITELLDAAVAGTTTISTWGGAGVAYTLSNNSGTADEARRMFIVATGSPGEAKNVICPAVSKFYVFRNDTTGGFALTLKTPSGTGISVPAGQYKFLYCDGTNVVEMFNSVGSLTLGTALAASSGGTGQSTYTAGDLIYATGATALAKLGIGASTTILTSSGTAPQWTTASSVSIGTATNLAGGLAGSVPYQSGAATTTFLSIGAANTVMTSSGTAPQWSTALTGLTGVSTTTATLSGDLTLSGGTANGVLYLNGSKVATSGSAITFDGTNFATTGSATATAFIPSGSSVPTNGMYLPAANTVAWSTNTTERARLDSSGNLGLGVTPQSTWNPNWRAIQLSGGTALSSWSGGTTNLFTNAFYDSTAVYKYIANGFATLYEQASGQHRWFNAPSGLAGNTATFTQAMTLDASGNLGLGVTPSAWISTAKALDINTLGAVFSGSGVGVGLSSNSYVGASNRVYKTTAAATDYWQLSGEHRWYNAPSGTAGTAITFTQAMTLTSGGNLLVKTTADNGVTCHFNGGANDNIVRLTGASTTNSGYIGMSGDNFTISTGAAISERARITSGGNFGIGTSAPPKLLSVNGEADVAAGSGYFRVKSGITDSHGIAFNYNNLGTGVGLIANTFGSGGLAFGGANIAEQMRLDASGSLLIGTTSTVSGSKLVVASADATIYGITVGRGAGAVAQNTAVGAVALGGGSQTGADNNAFGSYVLAANTTGYANTGFGGGGVYLDSALRYNTTGNYNAAFGTGALRANSTGSSNTAVGASSLYSNTASNNTAVGYQALYTNTTATGNVAVGYLAGYTSNATAAPSNVGANTFLGAFAGYSTTSALHSTFVGGAAGYNVNTGSSNTLVGRIAGYNLTSGTFNTFVGPGDSNGGSGYLVSTGGKNTIIGAYSGNQDGLDIRTASNYAIISDGDGNRLLSTANGYTLALDGGAVPQTGTGITFPATQSASSDANTLDDYEEGTFTPTIIGTTTAGTATYTARYAQYTKVGRQVTAYIYLNYISGTGTGNLRITGLPFTVGSQNFASCAIGIWSNIALTANSFPTAYCDSGSTTIILLQTPTNGGAAVAIPYDVEGELDLTVTYFV